MDAPRLNLLSRPALLGLVYRALAWDASGDDAPLTQRRIEHLQAQLTAHTKDISEQRATASILHTRAAEARRGATQAALDLRIFREGYSPPRRGFLRRPSASEIAAGKKLAELEAIDAHEAGVADAISRELSTVEAKLEKTEAQLAAAREQRAAMTATLQEQLAAHVLGLVAEGRADVARDALERARNEVRGDLMVGSLLVLTELFGAESYAAGIPAARAMLAQLEALFTQQPDPAARALALLLALIEGRALSQQELGLLGPGSFRVAAHYRLYQLVIVLAGGGVDPAEAPAAWAATLDILRPGADSTPSVSHDTIRLVFEGWHLLEAGRLESLWSRIKSILPPGYSSGLLAALGATSIPAWPTGLAPTWTAALACLTLLSLYAARTDDDAHLYPRWLEESYGWPKSDLYWWMLASLNADPALLRNVQGGQDQLFVVSS